MADKKMTDKDIIKALEELIHLAEYVDSDYKDCVEVSLLKNALDLINRLQAENERLKTEDVFEEIDNLIRYELEKEPAYESFEDVIVDYISFYCFYSSDDFIQNIIDQLENNLGKVHK